MHTIKVAVFGNDTKTEFRDNKEFSGSVFEQLEDVFGYLMLCNKTIATFKGLERVERSDYPQEAIREALLNAIVHRDYSFSGSIIINVNDSEMEFISIGGLVPGLSPDDIRSGISQPRIEVTTNTVKIVLPNMNGNYANKVTSVAPDVTPQMQAVIEFIEANGQITDNEVQELLEIKNTRAYTLMKKMEKDGLIVIVGRGVNKKYVKKD